MMKTREIAKVRKSVPTIEGAGVHLKRAFGFSQVPAFDPFLMLDDFRSDTPAHYIKGFPWHLHRGLRRSPMPSVVKSNTGTVWETKVPFPPATFSG